MPGRETVFVSIIYSLPWSAHLLDRIHTTHSLSKYFLSTYHARGPDLGTYSAMPETSERPCPVEHYSLEEASSARCQVVTSRGEEAARGRRCDESDGSNKWVTGEPWWGAAPGREVCSLHG